MCVARSNRTRCWNGLNYFTLIPPKEESMTTGRQLWEGAQFADRCGAKSATSLRFVALAQMLAEAEDAIVSGGRTNAGVGHLRELQAHCEAFIGSLDPMRKVVRKIWQRE